MVWATTRSPGQLTVPENVNCTMEQQHTSASGRWATWWGWRGCGEDVDAHLHQRQL